MEAWRRGLVAAGFDAPFADEDWALAASTAQERWAHRSYQLAYWRAVLSGVDPSEAVYGDAALPGHAELNALKRERFERHGPMDTLFPDPATRHLAELSAVRRRLSRAHERMTDADRAACEAMWGQHDARRQATLARYAPAIDALVAERAGTLADDAAAGFLLGDVPQVRVHWRGMPVHAARLGAGREFALYFAVNVEAPAGEDPGRVFAFHLLRPVPAADAALSLDEAWFLPMLRLAPVDDYLRYAGTRELALARLALAERNALVVPDILSALRGAP